MTNESTTPQPHEFYTLVADAEIYARRVLVPDNDSDVYTVEEWRGLQALARELGSWELTD